MCNNKYFEIDLLFLLTFNNDLWFIVLGKFPREYNDFQAARELLELCCAVDPEIHVGNYFLNYKF
jgi:hypothetical protein